MLELDVTFDRLSETFWKFGSFGLWLAVIIHSLFIFLFWHLGVDFMAVFNLFSVSLFLFCVYLLRYKKYDLILSLGNFEAILHALLATYAIGVGSGFYYYLFVLVIVAFVAPARSVRYKVGKITLFLTLFFAIELLFTHHTPPYPVDQTTLDYLRLFNLAGFLSIAVPILFYYVNIASETEKTLYNYATLDPLTGLFNRRYFVSMAEYEFSKRDNNTLSLILTDIDNFKKLNDTYGHHCGDSALILTSAELRSNLRESDILSRWGGEEFLFLLPATALDTAADIAERLRKEIGALEIDCSEQLKLNISATFGIAQRKDGESFDALLARADQALYEGKHSGKNRIVISH